MNITLKSDWQGFKNEFLVYQVLENSLQELIVKLKDYIRDTLEHFIVFLIFYIIICIVLYITVVRWNCFPFRSSIKHAKRVLFVTSHPDDEVMFFGPTILNFIRNKDNLVYIMCLSTGKNYGMGLIRKQELFDSCRVLGMKDENIFIQNHTDLPDKIDIKWPSNIIEKLILDKVEQYDINVLITFDRYGISNHLNHSSVYFAVANLIVDKKLPKLCSVYVLETVNLLRKYWLFLDIPLTYLMSRIRFMVSFQDRKIIHKAMRQHKSQLLWFRQIYMYFSRYMLINSLQKMDLSDVELDLEIEDDEEC